MAVTIRLETGILDGMIDDLRGKPHTKIVADGVHYGIYQEMGVQNGFGRGIVIPAHPFMRPAVEAVSNGFGKAFQNQLSLGQIDAVIEKVAHDIERIAKARAPFDTGALKNSIHVE